MRSVVFELHAGPQRIAAMWFQRFGAGVVDMHIHVAPEFRGRWVTPRILRQTTRHLRRLGFTAVLARPIPQHRHLTERLGFLPCATGYVLPLYEANHGHAQVQQQGAAAAAGRPEAGPHSGG